MQIPNSHSSTCLEDALITFRTSASCKMHQVRLSQKCSFPDLSWLARDRTKRSFSSIFAKVDEVSQVFLSRIFVLVLKYYLFKVYPTVYKDYDIFLYTILASGKNVDSRG